MRLFLSTACLLFLLANAAAAQQAQGGTRFWAAAGLGAGLPTSGGDGIGNLAQLVFQKDAHHLALRGLVLHDLDRSTETIGEIGVLYGRAGLLSRGVTMAAGVSGLAFDTCPDDDDSCFSLGLPVIVEAARGGKVLGVGVQVFANLNRKASYAGGALFLQLGRLR